jgi:hypothetical protein
MYLAALLRQKQTHEKLQEFAIPGGSSAQPRKLVHSRHPKAFSLAAPAWY